MLACSVSEEMSAGLAALLSSTSEERADHLEVAECARRHVFAIVGPRRFSLPRSSPNQHDISVRCFKALAPTRHFTNLQTDVWHSNEFAMSRTVAVRRHWQKHLECTHHRRESPCFMETNSCGQLSHLPSGGHTPDPPALLLSDSS